MTTAVLILLCLLLVLLLILIVSIVVFMKTENPADDLLEPCDYLIVYASQSGSTQHYAELTSVHLNHLGLSSNTININNLTKDHFQKNQKIIFMVSTYGEGDAPDSAQSFTRWFFHRNLDLSQLHIAVLAFGDRRYHKFCGFGEMLYQQLVHYGAKPWFDLSTVDQQSSIDLQHWNTLLGQVIGHRLQIESQQRHWHQVQLSERYLLNSGSQGNGLYHIVLEHSPALSWQSGDLLELRCSNTHNELKHFQQSYPLIDDEKLILFKFKNLRLIPNHQNDLSLEQWRDQFEDLPLREYSIASIPQQKYLGLVVRQEMSHQGIGLGSGLLTQKLNIGESLDVCIRSNPSFHLKPSQTPCIFIGNGSGIAGLMAHLHQCELQENLGNWLIFGERQQQFDAIFSEQLTWWQREGTLAQLDLVYSRDHSDYKYVQDVLCSKKQQLKSWIENGACIYVCGSLNGMAKAVDDQLKAILGEQQFNLLKQQQRYLRDVY